MKLLKPAKFESAFFKAGIYGLTGVGKSYTAMKIAIGFWNYIKAKYPKVELKPIAYADTEAGSDFLLDRFKVELEPIGLVVAKTRAFRDLVSIVDEATKECLVLIVDSITHYWNEMCKCYMEENKIDVITLNHWAPLKQTWREYSDKYVNNPLHIIMCGRSADLWEEVMNETGKLELKKKGTKMKAEGEMGYESNLLIEMGLEKVGPEKGGRYTHRAWINKDKFDVMNFEFFDDPKFQDFLPHISRLNIGGTHKAIEKGRSSKKMFEQKQTGYQIIRKKQQLLERIQNEIWEIYPGRTDEMKKKTFEIMKNIFGTNAWKQIEAKSVGELEHGLKLILAIPREEEKDEI